jgi:PAS domain S-box-containing protein
MLERTAFRKIAEILPEAVVVTDPQARITWTNQAFHDLCGHTRAFVRHRKPGDFLQGPDTDFESVETIRSALRRQEPVEAELLNYHADGHPYWVSLKITPLKDRKEHLVGFIALEREITDLRSQIHSLQHQVAELYSTLLGLIDPKESPATTGSAR